MTITATEGWDPVPADGGAQLQYRDADPDEHTHRYPDQHTHEHADGYSDQHANKYPDRHANSDGDGDGCLYSDGPTVHLPKAGFCCSLCCTSIGAPPGSQICC